MIKVGDIVRISNEKDENLVGLVVDKEDEPIFECDAGTYFEKMYNVLVQGYIINVDCYKIIEIIPRLQNKNEV